MEFTDYFYIFAHMRDNFEGKEYETFIPSEGDIVRINVHRNIRSTKRRYFVLVWPDETHRYIDTLPNIRELYCYCITLGGDFTHSFICFDSSIDTIVKPTIADTFEIVDNLRIKGFTYDRRNKKIIKR